MVSFLQIFQCSDYLKGVRVKSKSGQISTSNKVDFHKFILGNDEVEKSKDNIEIDIVLNTKDKAPGPAVIETAAEEHKEVSKWTGLVQD